MSQSNEEDIWLKVNGFTFLEHDPFTGINKWFKTEDDGATTFYFQQDITELLEINAATFTDTANRKLGDWVPLARPGDLMMDKLELSKAIEQKDRKFIGKVLNDPEYRKFRTSDLKV